LGGRRFLLERLNPAAERALGVSAAGAVGRTPPEFLPGDVAEAVRRGLERACLAGIWATEQFWSLPAGPRWFHTLLVPSQHPGQLPHRVAVVWRDVSEHKVFEQALCDREAMFRRLVETTNVIPWEADHLTQRFTYIGPQAVRRFGYPA